MNSSAVIDFGAFRVSGLAPTPDGAFLWVSQRDASRVVRIKGPLGASPVVDVVLGQTDAVGTQCNRGVILYSFDANRGKVNIYLKPFGP